MLRGTLIRTREGRDLLVEKKRKDSPRLYPELKVTVNDRAVQVKMHRLNTQHSPTYSVYTVPLHNVRAVEWRYSNSGWVPTNTDVVNPEDFDKEDFE